MSWRSALRRLLGIVPTLDLHGLGVQEAIAATAAFLEEARRRGEPEVRIVYGKGKGSPGGRGILREVIPRWLDEQGAPLVREWERLPDSSGLDGSVRVRLRFDSREGLP